jgi:tetratricopeptide (TPR) repeat protein
MPTDTYESEFEDALEMARALLGGNEDTSDLWEANDLVNHAISLRPADPEAWILKAQILSALEDDTAALASVEMAVRRAPRRAEAHYWRAAILSDLERYGEAIKAIERAFRALGADDEWLIEDLYYEKATVLDAIGRADEAMATYEAGLARCPESTLLKTALEPLRREQNRQRFTVLEGGRR